MKTVRVNGQATEVKQLKPSLKDRRPFIIDAFCHFSHWSRLAEIFGKLGRTFEKNSRKRLLCVYST